MESSDLHRVDEGSKQQAAETVIAAFAADPMTQQLHLPARAIRRMYSMPVAVGLSLGEVYAPSPAIEGVMVIIRGEHSDFGFGEIVRSGSVASALGLVRVFLNRHMRRMFSILEHDRKALEIGPYWYLSMIAVAPQHQGHGHAGKLLRFLCRRADGEQRAIYLETQTDSNVSLYEHFGFEVIKHVRITEGIAMWEMVRPPGE